MECGLANEYYSMEMALNAFDLDLSRFAPVSCNSLFYGDSPGRIRLRRFATLSCDSHFMVMTLNAFHVGLRGFALLGYNSFTCFHFGNTA